MPGTAVATGMAGSIARRSGPGWAAASSYKADNLRSAVVADFRNRRYAMPNVSAGAISGMTVSQIRSAVRAVTEDQFFSAFTSADDGTKRTYVGSDLRIKKDVLANKPRWDYTTGERRLLLEGDSTNLWTYSEDLTDASWTKTAVTITANEIAAPDGTMTADRAQETTGAALLIKGAATISTGVSYTASVYLKKHGSTPWARFILGSTATATNGVDVWVNLTTGAKGTVGPRGTGWTIIGYPKVQQLADGWCRVSVSFQSAADTTCQLLFCTANGDASTTRTVSGFYVWGIQLEAKPFASSYIPTVASAVTRAADSFRLPTVVEAVLQRTAATVAVRYILRGTAGTLLGNADGAHLLSVAAATSARTRLADGTTVTSTFSAGSQDYAGAAVGFNGSSRAVSGNRGTIANDNNPPSARTNCYLGRDAGTSNFGSGFYDELVIWPEKATNAAIVSAAAPVLRTPSTTVPSWVKIVSGITPAYDMDWENGRFWINGKQYMSMIELWIDGGLDVDDNVTRLLKLTTPLSGPFFIQHDANTKHGANNVVTTGRTFFGMFDSASGGDGIATTPNNSLSHGHFFDGGNGQQTFWSVRAGGVDYSTGQAWSIYRNNNLRQRFAGQVTSAASTHTVGNVAVQSDLTTALVTGIDRVIVGNRRQRDVPFNMAGEQTHRITCWQGSLSDTDLRALSV